MMTANAPQPEPIRPARPTGPVNPFEVFLLAACSVQGWAVLTRITQPQSVALLLPMWLQYMWGFLLLTGGVLSVSGLYWTDPFNGIEIKRVGLCAAAGGTGAYGVAVLALGPNGIVAGVTSLAFTFACGVRIMQVTRALKEARARIAAMRPPEEG